MTISTQITRIILLLGLLILGQSCASYDDDIDHLLSSPAGEDVEILTMVPLSGDRLILISSRFECVIPDNLGKKDFGNTETRIMASYSVSGSTFDENFGFVNKINVKWFEKIRTQKPVMWNGEDLATYGTSPIEIARSWALDCTDGYLTIPVQSTWGDSFDRHSLSLIGGVNSDNHLEFELRHNSNGLADSGTKEVVIAFDLNDILRNETPNKTGTVSIRLRWQSFSGEKTAVFDIFPRTQQTSDRISVLK